MAPAPKRPDTAAAVAALNAQIDAALAVVRPLAAFVQGIDADAKAAKVATAATASAVPTPTPQPGGSGAADWVPATELDALALARDAATLTRAHGTKISLLMINEPFTPSAIEKVVQELVNGPVPALAKAAEVCYGDRYTHHVRHELARRCGAVLEQVRQLLEAIPRDGCVVPEAKRTGGGRGGGGSSSSSSSTSKNNTALADRGSYTKIGILWAECDGVVAFCNRGVGGHLVQVVQQLADLLKDEQEELKEWGDEEDDDDDDDDDDDEDVDDSGYDDGDGDVRAAAPANPHDAAQAMLDALMDTRHIPPDDADGLRPRLETALKKIRLVVLLCRAVVKRRLNQLPRPLPTPRPSDVAARLDGAVAALQTVADRFEDLAAAFYKLSAEGVDTAMLQCFEAAVAASGLLARPWAGSHDEFTHWVDKFQAEMQVASSAD